MSYHTNIKIVKVNKERPRTSFVSYDIKEEAILNATNFEKSPYFINLNGKWQFYFNENPEEVPSDIATNVNQEDPKWCEITVPGNWERQGHGIAVYTNGTYDFCTINPQPPYLPKLNPVGVYRRKDIEIPQSWLDQKRDIFLQIGGVKTGLYVYVNGQEVGYSEDSKDPADFLINKYVHSGKDNVVTFFVYKYCTGSYLEDQDMWRLGGIERDVILYSQPRIHIQDFHSVSTLDDLYRNGIFKLIVNMVNHNETEEIDVEIGYELINQKNGQNVVCIHDHKNVLIKPNDEESVSFDENQIPYVLQWSAEHPNLYILLLTLKKIDDDSILEIVPFRIGFRREEIVDYKWCNTEVKVLLFNGKPIKFKGVNIHEHDQKTGHYVTDEVRLKDIELLKQNNFNALRFSHYPNCRRLYELCDEYGFYVVSECNIESHGMGFQPKYTLANKEIWLEAHMDRTKNNYERTKNHACVTFYSLGNEAGNGINMYATYKYLKENETNAQNRPINYEGARFQNNTDMFVPMYPKDDELEDYSSISDLPTVPCEYSHAMGNSNGNINKIWNVIYKFPNLQGGFIWDWVDQGFLEVGKGGKFYWTYGGDYGINMPSDGNFNINGIVNPDRNPHPAMAEIKYSQQNIGFEMEDIEKGIVVITNRFYFTDLSDYIIICSIMSNESVVKEINLSELNNNIAFLKPQQSVKVDLHSEIESLEQKVNTEYFLNFKVIKNSNNQPFIPKGFEVAHDQFELQIDPLPKTEKHETGPELSISQTEKSVIISSTKVEFVFNKIEGIVESYKIDGFEFISKSFGFQPNFWRGPTDNDYGNEGTFRDHKWKEMSHNFKITTCKVIKNENSIKLTVIYNLFSDQTFKIEYIILPSGIVKVNAEFHISPTCEYSDDSTIPRIGIRFRVPPQLHNVIYFGRGPQENYSDRYKGTQVGLYKTTAEDLYFPYVRPQENGHHIDIRWFAVDDEKLNGLLIMADKLIEFNALRNSVEDFDDEDQVDLPFQRKNFGRCEVADERLLRRQHHIDDVVPRDFVEINVDMKMQGLAGFDSWGDRVLQEDTIQMNQNHSYGFTLIPFNIESEIYEKLTHFYS